MIYYREKLTKLIEEAHKSGIRLVLQSDGEGLGIYFTDVVTNESCKVRNAKIKIQV